MRLTSRIVDYLAGLVERRGACAHPDGTARLVRSLLVALPGEVDLHVRGGCGLARRARAGEPARRLSAVPRWQGEAS